MIWTQIFNQLCEVCKKLGDLITSAGNMPQVEGLSLTRWCTTAEDGTQTTTGYSAVVIDEETGAPTTYYFDLTMAALTAAPEGEACIAVIEEPCYPLEGCNEDGVPVIKFIDKAGGIVSEFLAEILGFGVCVCPVGEDAAQCTILSLDTYTAPVPTSTGLNVGGATSATHSMKSSAIPAGAVAVINAAIAAGNIVQLVYKNIDGVVLGVFAGEGVAGTAAPNGFVLTADGATNTCDIGSTGVDTSALGGIWLTVDVKIIQA